MLFVSIVVISVIGMNGLDRFIAQIEESGHNLTHVLDTFNVTDLYDLQDIM